MAFCDFAYPQVKEQLDVRIIGTNLFTGIEPMSLRPEFAEMVSSGADLAAAISSDKAQREFVIAPILLELRRSLRGRFTLFSGVEWDVDRERGLAGNCDFILGRGPTQHILTAPFMTVVMAKSDLMRSGLAQCIAVMVAARISNERAGLPQASICGAVSTGAVWQFLRLDDDTITMDYSGHLTTDLPHLMGVLRAIIEPPAPGATPTT